MAITKDATLQSVFVDGTKYPLAVESYLPAKAPKISTLMTKLASKIPTTKLPFGGPPMMPTPPVKGTNNSQASASLKKWVNQVQVTPIAAQAAGITGAGAIYVKPGTTQLYFE